MEKTTEDMREKLAKKRLASKAVADRLASLAWTGWEKGEEVSISIESDPAEAVRIRVRSCGRETTITFPLPTQRNSPPPRVLVETASYKGDWLYLHYAHVQRVLTHLVADV